MATLFQCSHFLTSAGRGCCRSLNVLSFPFARPCIFCHIPIAGYFRSGNLDSLIILVFVCSNYLCIVIDINGLLRLMITTTLFINVSLLLPLFSKNHSFTSKDRVPSAGIIEWRLCKSRDISCGGIRLNHKKRQISFPCDFSMMTSSNGNIFRVTGHLCGEFTGHRWIPRTKASDAELWCFLWSTPE